MISILILSWNRPFHLFLTLISLFRVLKFSSLEFEIILLDQNSNNFTKYIINKFKYTKLILLKKNVGMAEGWNMLYSNINVKSKFILQLENDWWCINSSDEFLKTAIEGLSQTNCAFIKLRKNFDLQAGVGMINKEPQTIYPFPFHLFKIAKIGKNWCLYSDSRYSCFTFNPTLMKVEFRLEIENYYRNNKFSKIDILRSGEDLPTIYWENQNKWISGIINNPAFIHTGFHSRRYSLMKLPLFYLVELFKWIRVAVFK